MMKALPILILRAITILSGVAGVLVCLFALPPFGTSIARELPEYAFWQYPILVGLYSAAACFFFALFQFWLILNGMDKGILQTRNLKIVRISAITFAVLYYLSAMPVIYLAADSGDAPGLILIGAFLGTFPIGVAAFALVLERLSKQ